LQLHEAHLRAVADVRGRHNEGCCGRQLAPDDRRLVLPASDDGRLRDVRCWHVVDLSLEGRVATRAERDGGRSSMRRGYAFVLAAALVVALAIAAPAQGASSITIRLGQNGAARLTSGGPNSLYVNLKALADGTWAEGLYAGTCAHLGVRIVGLPAL